MSEHGTPSTPRIEITLNGPYRVTGDVAIHDANANILSNNANVCLCRCGGSRNKPFCDATLGYTEGPVTAGQAVIARFYSTWQLQPTGKWLVVFDNGYVPCAR